MLLEWTMTIGLDVF